MAVAIYITTMGSYLSVAWLSAGTVLARSDFIFCKRSRADELLWPTYSDDHSRTIDIIFFLVELQPNYVSQRMERKNEIKPWKRNVYVSVCDVQGLGDKASEGDEKTLMPQELTAMHLLWFQILFPIRLF